MKEEKEEQKPHDHTFHLYVHAYIHISTNTGDMLISYVQLQLPECLDGVPAKRKGRTGAIINSIEFR